ncbi:MAG: DinB family protein, partial [Calditrichaeota bacterium]|nr:DinB family protein [Calditrichota bacterium]
PEGDILEILAAQRDSTRELLHGLTEVQGDFRYAPGKWTIKELLGHLV